jgi:hypothetical protein
MFFLPKPNFFKVEFCSKASEKLATPISLILFFSSIKNLSIRKLLPSLSEVKLGFSCIASIITCAPSFPMLEFAYLI